MSVSTPILMMPSETWAWAAGAARAPIAPMMTSSQYLSMR